MAFLIPFLAPVLFPISLFSNIMELLTGNVALSGTSFWDQFVSFWGLVWHSMTVWL